MYLPSPGGTGPNVIMTDFYLGVTMEQVSASTLQNQPGNYSLCRSQWEGQAPPVVDVQWVFIITFITPNLC